MASIFSFFRKKKPSVGEQMAVSAPVEDELNKLLKQLIEETKSALEKEFNEQISNYKAKGHPLGPEDAKKIMEHLVGKAVTSRNDLSGRIERSIAVGELYGRYYNKIAVINDLTNDAYEKMNEMRGYKQRFETKEHLYNSVTGYMYLQKINNAAKENRDNTIVKDQGNEIEKVGGELDNAEINL